MANKNEKKIERMAIQAQKQKKKQKERKKESKRLCLKWVSNFLLSNDLEIVFVDGSLINRDNSIR